MFLCVTNIVKSPHTDIDECQSSPCNVTCVNTEGSFRCECPLGQRLADDGISCHGKRQQCLYCPDTV